MSEEPSGNMKNLLSCAKAMIPWKKCGLVTLGLNPRASTPFTPRVRNFFCRNLKPILEFKFILEFMSLLSLFHELIWVYIDWYRWCLYEFSLTLPWAVKQTLLTLEERRRYSTQMPQRAQGREQLWMWSEFVWQKLFKQFSFLHHLSCFIIFISYSEVFADCVIEDHKRS